MNTISILLFIFGVSSCLAIQCYVHPETPQDNDPGRVTDCSGQEDRCAKIIRMVGGERPLYTRTCGVSSKIDCETVREGNTKVDTCYCDQNHCNAGTFTAGSAMLIVVMLVPLLAGMAAA